MTRCASNARPMKLAFSATCRHTPAASLPSGARRCLSAPLPVSSHPRLPGPPAPGRLRSPGWARPVCQRPPLRAAALLRLRTRPAYRRAAGGAYRSGSARRGRYRSGRDRDRQHLPAHHRRHSRRHRARRGEMAGTASRLRTGRRRFAFWITSCRSENGVLGPPPGKSPHGTSVGQNARSGKGRICGAARTASDRSNR